jgi:hypothetical protein
LADWVVLCAPCHRAYDDERGRGMIAKQFHYDAAARRYRGRKS